MKDSIHRSIYPLRCTSAGWCVWVPDSECRSKALTVYKSCSKRRNEESEGEGSASIIYCTCGTRREAARRPLLTHLGGVVGTLAALSHPLSRWSLCYVCSNSHAHARVLYPSRVMCMDWTVTLSLKWQKWQVSDRKAFNLLKCILKCKKYYYYYYY